MGINAPSKEWKFNLCSCNQVHEKDKFCLAMMRMKIGSQELLKQQTLNSKIVLELHVICERRKREDIHTKCACTPSLHITVVKNIWLPIL